MLYQKLVRPLLFHCDPERAHDVALHLATFGQTFGLDALLGRALAVCDPRLRVSAFGIEFQNPIGLAAGFDKNAQAVQLLAALGFGHVEVGTVTLKPQPGNPKPRIFRLLEDRALINRMGFPSQGVDRVVGRLKSGAGDTVVGVNIGKNKELALEQAPEHYAAIARTLGDRPSFLTINVSSPNTPELRKLQEPERLRLLLEAVRAASPPDQPLLIKIAPDLSLAEIDTLLEVAIQADVAGIIATNTTFERPGIEDEGSEQGGLSGAPLQARALEVVDHLYKSVGDKLTIIGVGGISSGADVLRFMSHGASLVQVYTGLIYQGPFMVRTILREIVEFMDQHAIKSLNDIKGTVPAAP